MSKLNSEQPLINAEMIEVIRELYHIFEDYEKVAFWMNTDNLNLGGMSPVTLFRRGLGHKVLQFVRSVEDME